MSAAASAAVARRDYPALLLLGMIDAAGYSVIAPVLPALAAATGAGPAVAGALAASFPAAMIAGFALAGLAAGRRSTAAILAAGLVVAGLGAAGFVLGSGLGVYFAARSLMGLGSGALWIGVTLGTLQRWPGQEYLCMSRVFAAYSAGGLVGPALGALGGIRAPFLAYLALTSAALVMVAFMGRPPERAFGSDWGALRVRGFWTAALGILFTTLGLGVVEGVLPLHFGSDLSQAEIGGLYVAMSVIFTLAAAAAGRFRPRLMLGASLVLVVGGLWAAGAPGGLAVWVPALAANAIGLGIGNTGSLGILLESVRPERMVAALVIWSQLGILGYAAGPLAGGGVAEAFGFGALGLVPLAAAASVGVAFARSS